MQCGMCGVCVRARVPRCSQAGPGRVRRALRLPWYRGEDAADAAPGPAPPPRAHPASPRACCVPAGKLALRSCRFEAPGGRLSLSGPVDRGPSPLLLDRLVRAPAGKRIKVRPGSEGFPGRLRVAPQGSLWAESPEVPQRGCERGAVLEPLEELQEPQETRELARRAARKRSRGCGGATSAGRDHQGARRPTRGPGTSPEPALGNSWGAATWQGPRGHLGRRRGHKGFHLPTAALPGDYWDALRVGLGKNKIQRRRSSEMPSVMPAQGQCPGPGTLTSSRVTAVM